LPSPSPALARPTYNMVSAVSEIYVVRSGVFRLRSLVSPVTSRSLLSTRSSSPNLH
jgi:hypothetical protein